VVTVIIMVVIVRGGACKERYQHKAILNVKYLFASSHHGREHFHREERRIAARHDGRVDGGRRTSPQALGLQELKEGKCFLRQ
jgi:hypothetical protein